MTVVAVKKEKNFIQIACDSEISYWWSGHKISDSVALSNQVKDYSKIFQVNEMVFWCAGAVEDALVFKQRAQTNLPKSSRIDDVEDYFLNLYKHFKERKSTWSSDFQCLMVFEWKMFYVRNYCIYEVDEYESIWSGAAYARTALFLWKTASESVDVAKVFAAWCGGSTTSIEVSLKK